MFNFLSLRGAQSSSSASQSILELDGGVKILIDCGWDSDFSTDSLVDLERQIPTLSIVLLTHATIEHLGAYAHCCKHFPAFTRIPVYATNPVISLGRTLLQDVYSSTPLAYGTIPQAALDESAYSLATPSFDSDSKILLQPPTADEIANYFSLVQPLKYSQPHEPLASPFSPPLNGLTITAYSAGHSLGGTIWHISHGLESIVYAVDWNQAREHVLAGAAWLGPAGAGGAEVIDNLRRPTALVCSSRGAERVALPGGMKRRDEVLLDHIKNTVMRGGTVLIPSDSTARVLELAFLLETTWHADASNARELQQTHLFMASRSCGATMRHAGSSLEWMEEGIVRDFETAASANTKKGHQRTGSKSDGGPVQVDSAPFDFKYLKLIEGKTRFRKWLEKEGAKVILATDDSLDWGYSKDALQALATDPNNLIILTEPSTVTKGGQKSLQDYLWSAYSSSNPTEDQTSASSTNGTSVPFRNVQTEPLTSTETPLYQSYLVRQRQLQTSVQVGQAATLEASADVVDDAASASSSSSEEDSDDEQQGKLLATSASLSKRDNKLVSDAELGINVLLRKKGVHDYDVRGKRGRERSFPFVSKRRRADDFGDAIRPEDYLRAEERDELDGEDMRNGTTAKPETAVGEKRKWGDMAVQPSSAANNRRMSNGVNKRRRTEDATDGDGVMGGEGEISESSEDEEENEQEQDGPRKLITKQEQLQLNVRIAFVDFSARHDKRSLQMLIPLIRPRKLILIGGSEAETQALATDCRKLLAVEEDHLEDSDQSAEGREKGSDVFTPVVGEVIDASVDTNAWIVKLSAPLVRQLKWQNVRGLGVVALTGQLEAAPPPEEEEVKAEEEAPPKSKKARTIKNEMPEITAQGNTAKDAEAPPILDVLPTNLAAATRFATAPLHVGDLRLADLRKLMQAAGYTAEFRGEGTLLVGGIVTVRKSGTGKIEVEGALLGSDTVGLGVERTMGRVNGKTFYEVKRKIYEGLAVVAGG